MHSDTCMSFEGTLKRWDATICTECQNNNIDLGNILHIVKIRFASAFIPEED